MRKKPPSTLAETIGISGACFEVFALVCLDGTVPVVEWLDRQDPGTRARYALKFKRLCEQGLTKMRGDDFHKLDEKRTKGSGGLSEFKDIASKTRILCFFDGEGIVLLAHPFGGKKEDKTPEREILAGIRARDDYFRRKKGN